MPKIRSSTEFLRAYFLYSSSLSFVPLMFSGFQFCSRSTCKCHSLLHLSFSDVLSLDSYGQLSKLDYRIGGIFFLSLSRIISQSCISFLFFGNSSSVFNTLCYMKDVNHPSIRIQKLIARHNQQSFIVLVQDAQFMS